MTETVGDRLRNAREGKGLSVDDMSARLRIPARYVRALEQGDMAALPEPTFVRGYLKSYARELGLDGEALATELVPTVEVKAPRPLLAVDGGASGRKASAGRAPNFRGGSGTKKRAIKILLLVIPLLAIVALIAVLLTTHSPTSRVSEAASSDVALPEATMRSGVSSGVPIEASVSLPLPAAPAQPEAALDATATPASTNVPAPITNNQTVSLPMPAPGVTTTSANTTATAPAVTTAAPASNAATSVLGKPVAATKRGLFIRFSADSWVEVRDADNRVLHASVQTNGSVLTLDGKAPLTITLGNVSAAEVWFNGALQPSRNSSVRVGRVIVGQVTR